MGIWSRITRFLGFGRAQPIDPYTRLGYLPMQYIPAGVRVTMENALQISAVWACVTIIAESISSQPLNIFTRDDMQRRRLLPDDAVTYLLNVRPNAEVTAMAFKEALLAMALSWGNGYAEIVRDDANRVVELQFLPSDRVTPRRRPKEQNYRLYYEYAQPGTGDYVDLDPKDVLHIRGPGVTSLLGDNVISRASLAIATAMAQERFAASYFGNNAVLGGVLEYPGKLAPESHERIRNSWDEQYKGPSRAHKVAILENGMKYVPFATNAESAQLIQARQFQIQEICRIFKVPPHKIGDLSRSTNNNIEWQGLEWVRDCLAPWAVRFQQEVDYKLFSRRGLPRFSEIDLSGLSHGDAKSRADYYKVMIESGILSINEVRELEGFNHIGPDGDVRIVPLNMQTLEQIQLAEEKAELELEQLGEDAKREAEESERLESGETEELEEEQGVEPAMLADSPIDRRSIRVNGRQARRASREVPACA